MKTPDISSLAIGLHEDKTGNGIQFSLFEKVDEKYVKCNISVISNGFSYDGTLIMDNFHNTSIHAYIEDNRLRGILSFISHGESPGSVHIRSIRDNLIEIRGNVHSAGFVQKLTFDFTITDEESGDFAAKLEEIVDALK